MLALRVFKLGKASSLNRHSRIGAMVRYPVNLKPAKEGGFVVTFPDVPEAISQGEDQNDALRHAVDALESALEFYTEAGREFPALSEPKPGQLVIEIPWGR